MAIEMLAPLSEKKKALIFFTVGLSCAGVSAVVLAAGELVWTWASKAAARGMGFVRVLMGCGAAGADSVAGEMASLAPETGKAGSTGTTAFGPHAVHMGSTSISTTTLAHAR